MKKAMILAAGHGRRLRPLTASCPKPLLPVGGKRLIEYHLERLVDLGIREVVINVSYLAEQVVATLGNGSKYGVQISYSHETNGPLGALGGICKALPLLGGDPFLLLSADVWTDQVFSSQLLANGSGVHLLLADNPEYHPDGDYGLAADGKLQLSGKKFNYAGIARIDPQYIERSQDQSFDAMIRRLIVAGAVTGELIAAEWINVGTLSELKKLQQLLGEPAV